VSPKLLLEIILTLVQQNGMQTVKPSANCHNFFRLDPSRGGTLTHRTNGRYETPVCW
jgi:hypothetical protein